MKSLISLCVVLSIAAVTLGQNPFGGLMNPQVAVDTSPGLVGDIVPLGSVVQQNPYGGLMNPTSDGAKAVAGTSPGLVANIVPLGSVVQQNPFGGLMNPTSDGAKAVAGTSPGLGDDIVPMRSVRKQFDGIKGQAGGPEKMAQKSQGNTWRRTGQYQKKAPYQKQMSGEENRRAYPWKDTGMMNQRRKYTGQ